MNDAEFKAYVADRLIGIAHCELTLVEKDIFFKLEKMGVLTLDSYREVNYAKDKLEIG